MIAAQLLIVLPRTRLWPVLLAQRTATCGLCYVFFFLAWYVGSCWLCSRHVNGYCVVDGPRNTRLLHGFIRNTWCIPGINSTYTYTWFIIQQNQHNYTDSRCHFETERCAAQRNRPRRRDTAREYGSAQVQQEGGAHVPMARMLCIVI